MKTFRIGILGGSFDPVHIGHVSLGRAAVSEAELDKLIVMPAYIQPFKQGKQVSDDEHRLAMTRLAFEDVPRAEVSSFEIGRMCISYTFDTLEAMREQYPDGEIFFITGADSFVKIDTWYKGIELLTHFSFIVSARPGCEEYETAQKIKEYEEKYHTRILKLAAQMPDISSTELRLMYGEGKTSDGLVPEKAERYITEHGLYQRD